MKSLTKDSLQDEMDTSAARVVNAPGPASHILAKKACANIAAKARRAGFSIKNPHPLEKDDWKKARHDIAAKRPAPKP